MSKETGSLMISPWLIVAGSGLVAPFVLLLLVWAVPGLRGYDIFAREDLFARFPGFHFGPMEGFPLTCMCVALSVYIGLGASHFKRTVKSRADLTYGSTLARVRSVAAEALLVLSVAALLLPLPLLSSAWAVAMDNGQVACCPWSENLGNHGPWHFTYSLKTLVIPAIFLPFASLAFGALSFVIRPGVRAVLVVFCSIPILFFLVWTHGWLID